MCRLFVGLHFDCISKVLMCVEGHIEGHIEGHVEVKHGLPQVTGQWKTHRMKLAYCYKKSRTLAVGA